MALNYNYFRDYDPTIGRYVQSDRIGISGGINTYLYALANPSSYQDPTGEFVPLVTAGIGALAGFGGSVIGQLISNGGNLQCVSWKNAFIAGGVGAVAGAAAPFLATTWLGAAGLGSGANVIQYGVTQYANNLPMTAAGAGWSAATGALGGVIGGRIVRPAIRFNERSPWLDSALARALNRESQIAANTGIGSLSRNVGGATVGSVDPASASSECGCR